MDFHTLVYLSYDTPNSHQLLQICACIAVKTYARLVSAKFSGSALFSSTSSYDYYQSSCGTTTYHCNTEPVYRVFSIASSNSIGFPSAMTAIHCLVVHRWF